MSQHSTASATRATSTKTTSTEPSAKPGSSASGSLKKLKKKDADVPLTDDFVLMTTPDKFKDRNINEKNVLAEQRTDTSPNDKVNLECLLLSDTTEQSDAPQHVKIFLQHFDSTQLSQAEILFLLAYLIALESGFIGNYSEYEHAKLVVNDLSATSSFHAKNILHLSRLIPNYKATDNRTRFALTLRTLINVTPECNDHLYALLNGIVTGDLLIVTLTPANSTGAKGYSTSLSIGRYVLSLQSKNNPIHQRFCKLKELSFILRDQLFVPMRCQQLYWLQCYINPSLDGMPPELYKHIFKYLSKNQLHILANVNTSLNNLIISSGFI